MTVLFDYALPLAAFFAAVVWILFFRKDQFDAYKARPDCYMSAPGPQEQAENDCATCPWQHACLWVDTVPADVLLPPHYLRAERTPKVSMFGVCSTCRTRWHSNDGKCSTCRIGYEVEP